MTAQPGQQFDTARLHYERNAMDEDTNPPFEESRVQPKKCEMFGCNEAVVFNLTLAPGTMIALCQKHAEEIEA